MLKLDPKNTELLAQKQAVLKQNIEQTSNKLKGLEEAQRRFIESGGNLDSPEYRNLQREIIITTNELKKLQLEQSKWTQASQNLGKIGTTLSSIGNKVSDLGKKFTTLSATIAGTLGMGVKFNSELETSTKAFETFLGSTEKAEKAISEIKNQSKSSIFDTKELIKANQMLITTGEDADSAKKTISSLADAIALTGGGNDELNRMASNLQQIKNAGKATSMDIRQFAYAGIDVYGILASTTGKTVEEIKKMDITYKELSNALNKASSEGGKYYHGQIKMTDTLGGQVNKLKKSFQELLGELSSSLMPIVKNITNSIQNLVDKFRGLSDEQKQMITRIGLIVAAIGPVLLIVGKIISFAGTIFNVLSKISSLIAGLTTGTSTLSGVLAALTGPIGIIIAAVGALTAALIYLYNTNEDFKNTINAMWNEIVNTFNEHVKPTFQELIVVVKELWEKVIKPFGEFLWSFWSPMLISIFSKIGGVFTVLFTQWSKIISNIMGALKGLIDFVLGVFSGDWERAWQGITNMVKNIFGAVVNYVKIPMNTIISLINGAIRGINQIKIPDWVPGVGGKGINIPLIPKLAKGGIVNKATLAMIGEGHSAEAVIPLDSKLTKYFAEALKQVGGNQSIQVNFYPQSMTEAEIDRAFNYIDRKFGMLYS